MARGAATSERSSGETTSHFASIRIRVNGTGNLQLFVYSLDDMNSKAIAPLPMAVANRYAVTRIVNFVEQRASFVLRTTELGKSSESIES